MDVSDILAAQAERQKAITVEKEIPLEVDVGYLTVTDLNPIDKESYTENLEECLQSTARDGIQVLLASLFSLPTTSSEDGPLAVLPPPTTLLPRSKPLPKPKPPTKWEKFARAKGIQKTVKDKKVWDEEKQEWVNRWGWKGKNKEAETQWATPVSANADVDFDPAKKARDERKARVAKNEKQHSANLARAQGTAGSGAAPAPDREARKSDISRTLATTRFSTASMGKFDKKLDGDKPLRGVKRKFDPAEASAEAEKKSNLALLAKLGNAPTKRAKGEGNDAAINVRKAGLTLLASNHHDPLQHNLVSLTRRRFYLRDSTSPVKHTSASELPETPCPPNLSPSRRQGPPSNLTMVPTLRSGSSAQTAGTPTQISWKNSVAEISEWRTFANDEGDDPSRVGAASDPLLDGMEQLDTVISFKDGGSGIARELQRAASRGQSSRSERNIISAFRDISTMCDQFSLPKTISDIAKQMYKRADDEKLLRGKPLEAVIAACIFIACRQAHVPRTFREICQLTHVSKKVLGQCYKALEATFSLQPGASAQAQNGRPGAARQSGPEDLLVRYCSHLALPPYVEGYCRDVIVAAREHGVADGRSPVSIAGGAIFFTCQLLGVNKSMRDIMDIAGVSEGTIRLVYKLYFADREKLVKKEWLENGRAKMERLQLEPGAGR
ncbi:unnamed protein product [Peniophora sp. CBMAI 1063]|nr:unnamed protein product [Peniophora sp. CBMAI 1063]